jgi:hypothetical protein
MNFLLIPIFSAALLGLALGLAAVIRKSRTRASWFFFGGLMALAVEAVFGAFAMESTAPAQVDRWLTASIFAKALLPSLWTGFTVAYCRADAGSVLRRLRNPLLLSLGIPLGIAVVFRQGLVEVSYSESARQWAFDLSIWARD